jgi:hypothetical protein
MVQSVYFDANGARQEARYMRLAGQQGVNEWNWTVKHHPTKRLPLFVAQLNATIHPLTSETTKTWWY